MGGGHTDGHDDYKVFLYNKTENNWSDLPPCTVRWFGLALFKNTLITVGGQRQSPTTKVMALSADSKRWEKLIPPMLTARHSLSVITTSTAIIAAGGTSSGVLIGNCIATVEIYSDNTSQWYTAEPLPAPREDMSSVVIGDFCYLMGDNDCYRASLSSLIQKATSPTPPSATSSESLWETLPPTPLKDCSAVCLNGSLMTVGGVSRGGGVASAVYEFFNSRWVRLTDADLPAARSSCGITQLSSHEVIVVGGWLNIYTELNDVYIGTMLKD